MTDAWSRPDGMQTVGDVGPARGASATDGATSRVVRAPASQPKNVSLCSTLTDSNSQVSN
jgi:hypothetical protein